MPLQKPRAAALLASPQDIENQFYEALQKGDIEALMSVWSDDDEIVCVHPGGPRVVGHAAIRASFEAIFAHNAIPVHPEQLHQLNTGHTSVHSVMERIEVPTEKGTESAWVVATNVYVKTAQGWRLAAHHASPGAPPELQAVLESPSVLH